MSLHFVTFVLAAILAIAANLLWPGQFWQYAALKSLTTVLVIAHAALRGMPHEPRRKAVLIGLSLSLVGDVALLWPQHGFLPGLVAFLLAHLAYLVAFTRGVRFGAWPLAFVAYALLAGSVLWFLWPGLPEALRWPVVVYVLALAAMAAQTASAWHATRGTAAEPLMRYAAIGGALFLLSDALLAINRFHTPLSGSALWILATYWAAQWLIASALAPRRSLLE